MQQKDILKKIANLLYLPSLRELKIAFPLRESFKIGSAGFPYVNPNFTRFQDEKHNYQVYTKEFINSLAKYLASRVKKIGKEVTILEVGAGDGRLTAFLAASPFLRKTTKIIATDNKDWEKSGDTSPSKGVLKMDYKAALKEFGIQPTIILSCWMNIEVNWTVDFRNNPYVREYILIGDIFRTAGYGSGWYLPKNSGFKCVELSKGKNNKKKGIVIGSLGRFAGSPFNFETRSQVYSFRRV